MPYNMSTATYHTNCKLYCAVGKLMSNIGVGRDSYNITEPESEYVTGKMQAAACHEQNMSLMPCYNKGEP
jgi:hypothetical protein